MKKCLQCLVALIILVPCALPGYAQETEGNDTVYFYQSWEQMLYMEPAAMLVNPLIFAPSIFDVTIMSDDALVNERINQDDFIALTLGDSIWLAKAEYFGDHFKGDVMSFGGLVPIFFNEKVAYLMYPGKATVKELFSGEDEEVLEYYYIDFGQKRVKRVTSSYLSHLLEDYHDLQMRYEGMKDYKKRYMIEEFFLKYVDRASEDFLRPDILDLVE